MKLEDIIALGVEQGVAEKVLEAHKTTIADSFVPKHRFDEVNGERETLKETIKDRDSQITQLSEFKGTNEELQAKINTLTEENQAKEAKFAEELQKERKVNAIKTTLLSNKEHRPYDADIVMGLLDVDAIELAEDGSLKADKLNEQLGTLQETHKFLFEKVEAGSGAAKPPFSVVGAEPKDIPGGQPNVDKAASYGARLAKAKLGNSGISKE